MVLGVFVDAPHVVMARTRKDVPRGQHRGHHGMVLVIVLVHAVATDEMQRREVGFEVETDRPWLTILPAPAPEPKKP